jgi:hypothetical protein
MTPHRLTLLVGAALAAAPVPARAQDSQFGIAGLGTPGRWESAASRAGAGAFAAFDPASALSEAALVEIRTLAASTGWGASYRHVEAPGTSTWLRGTRYPLFTVGGPLARHMFVSGGYSTYLDKNYNVVTRDSVVLRGVMQPYTDAIASDGGVTDVRLAAAGRLGAHLALGVGLHLLAGSTRMSATRRFDDTTAYLTAPQTGTVRYTGQGVSASALLTLTRTLSLAAVARRDNHLNAYVGDSLVAHSELPTTLGGAVRWVPVPSARVAGSVLWRSWSRAGPNAFDTVNWTAGLELGTRAPFRVGVRGGQLPFGGTGSAPTELGVAAGSTRIVANGRGFVDVGIERLARDAGTVHERVWTLLVGLTIRP